MQKSHLNPLDVINHHLRDLLQRLTASSDPGERELLHKRLKIMMQVRQFIRSNLSYYHSQTAT